MLPPEEVEDCFAFDLISIAPKDDRVRAFCDYVLENYISDDSRFPPNLWAEFSSSSARTTNACESFHSHLNAILQCSS